MNYFLSYSQSKNKIEVELDLSNYSTKSNLKNGTGVDTSQFAKKNHVVNLKPEVAKLDINKFKKCPT